MPLFTDADLSEWLGKTVSPDRAVLVERVVWGWVKAVLGSDERPDPVPEELFSAAVELGAIAFENPSSLTDRGLGPFSESFPIERRQEILDEIARTLGPAGLADAPQGEFPDALAYPDPAW